MWYEVLMLAARHVCHGAARREPSESANVWHSAMGSGVSPGTCRVGHGGHKAGRALDTRAEGVPTKWQPFVLCPVVFVLLNGLALAVACSGVLRWEVSEERGDEPKAKRGRAR